MMTIAMFSLALNLPLAGVFIVAVRRLISTAEQRALPAGTVAMA